MSDNDDLVGDVTQAQEILPPENELRFREELFCLKYIEYNRNGMRAAIACGYSPASANATAIALIKRPEIRARIIEIVAPVLRKAELDVEEMLGQIHAVATFDRRKMFNPDGTRKLFHELDAKTAAAISHMGPNDFQPFNKMQAIEMAMRQLGGFEKDNKQKGESLKIVVAFE